MSIFRQARTASFLFLTSILLSGCQPPQPEFKKSDPKASTGTLERTEAVVVPSVNEPNTPFPEVSFEMRELGGKTMLMHYMPWYEAPPLRPWGTHWTGHQREHNPEVIKENGLPDIWSHYHPLIGLYDSSDPDVLECHLLQMKLAGVNGVIADWYGIAPHADFPPIHDATKALFDACERYGMTFAACYEDRTIDLMVNHFKVMQVEEITDHLTETFAWMQDNWFTKPHYQNYQDRPLLLNFGPIYGELLKPEPWDNAMDPLLVRPNFFGLHHLWKKAGADGGFTWVHFDPFDDVSDQATVNRRINESFTWFTDDPNKAIVSAYPGFKDVYGQGGQVLEHMDGKVLRDTLQVGINGPWEIIQLVTWNDYGEGTMFEPTHEFGYQFLEILQEGRRKELGEAFTFTANDLRLPALLYNMRKTNVFSSEELDEIAAQIANGDCEAARQAIQSIQANM